MHGRVNRQASSFHAHVGKSKSAIKKTLTLIRVMFISRRAEEVGVCFQFGSQLLGLAEYVARRDVR